MLIYRVYRAVKEEYGRLIVEIQEAVKRDAAAQVAKAVTHGHNDDYCTVEGAIKVAQAVKDATDGGTTYYVSGTCQSVVEIHWQSNRDEGYTPWYAPHFAGRLNVTEGTLRLLCKIGKTVGDTPTPERVLEALDKLHAVPVQYMEHDRWAPDETQRTTLVPAYKVAS